MSVSVDPITVEVIRNGLLSAAREMATNLMRSAYNTMIYEIRDFGLGIYDKQGQLLADSPAGLAVFVRANDFAVGSIIEHVGYEKIFPGDVFLLNYPYWSSSHILDVACISPIFVQDELIGFTAVRAHWLDLDQKDAGYCLDTTDRYQEGLCLPAVKIYRRGELNEDVVQVIRFNSRMPERVIGDMHAQISAARIGAQRTTEIVEKFGREVFDGARTEILDHGERLARLGLAKLPRGTWSAEDYVDDDGIDDRLVKMKVTVTVTDDEMIVDWTGSDPATKGPLNLPIGQTIGVSGLIFKAVTSPDSPANGGNFRALRVIAPEGSVMHAVPPMPTFVLWTGLLAGEVILKALAQGMPDLIAACSGGDVCSMIGLGVNPRSGRAWLEATNEAVGFGGHAGADGEDGIMHLTEPGGQNNPVEVVETKAPMLIESYGFRTDSGGPGLHRGGVGVSRAYRFLADSTALMIVKKTKTKPWAISGGLEGENCHVTLNPGTSREEVLGSFNRPFKTGDILVNHAGGGGGWGDPFQRDPHVVARDVALGFVSELSARADYGVAIDTAGQLDAAATEALRAADGMRSASIDAVSGAASTRP